MGLLISVYTWLTVSFWAQGEKVGFGERANLMESAWVMVGQKAGELFACPGDMLPVTHSSPTFYNPVNPSKLE